MTARKIIIDTDPGHDDAIAIPSRSARRSWTWWL
jgi:inosine-uridine nucleoside N-ribohydrolase